MSDIKQDVKECVKIFIQVFVSSLVKELTKKLIKSLSQRQKKILESRSKKMSDDQLTEYLENNPYFKKAVEKIINSVCNLPSAKGTGSLVTKLESISETTSFVNNPINALILPAPKVIVAVAASTAVVTTAAVSVALISLPVANFTANVTEGIVPLTVNFTDSSQNATTCKWDFGDGNNSNEQNITHTYYSAGDYTVKLTVTNVKGSDSKNLTISVQQPPILPFANFSSNVSQGYAPFSVQFNDTSEGTPTQWFWDFGDKNYSSEQNITHTFFSKGNYTINLTVSNENGTNFTSNFIYVTPEEYVHL